MAPSVASLGGSVRLVLYVVYCIEGGLFLALVPWSWMWRQNVLLAHSSWLSSIGLHPVTRGLVSGIGVALLVHGIQEVVRFVFARPGADRPARGGTGR